MDVPGEQIRTRVVVCFFLRHTGEWPENYLRTRSVGAWCVPVKFLRKPPATPRGLVRDRGSLSSTAVPDIYLPREENTAGMRIRQGPYDFQQARSVQPRIERKNSVDECRVNKRCVRWSCCTYAQKEKEWKRRVSKGAEGKSGRQVPSCTVHGDRRRRRRWRRLGVGQNVLTVSELKRDAHRIWSTDDPHYWIVQKQPMIFNETMGVSWLPYGY